MNAVISMQSGLEFVKEKREMEVWFGGEKK
jgi:hypothetical protein